VSGSRFRNRRFGAILATALFTIALMPGLATAQDTRILWIGAPDLSVVDANNVPVNSGKLYVNQGQLTQLPTKVSKPAAGTGPNATMFQVEILNTGGQNLAHTILTINADAQGTLRCPIVPPATAPPATCLDSQKVSPRCPIVPPATVPSATCLDSLKLAKIYDPNPAGQDDASSTFCSTPGDVITCNYGSLGAGASRTVAVVVNVTSDYDAASQVTPLFSATVTTNNENGSNTQTFSADSGAEFDSLGNPIPNALFYKVSAFAENSLYTFALDGVSEDLSTSVVGGAAGNLNTKVSFNSANKELVRINEGSTTTSGFYMCPSGLSCQDDYSEATTTSGFFSTSPFFTWKLTAIVPKTYALSQGFVAHYPVGATTFIEPDPTNAYWKLLFKNKSALCGTDVAAKILSAHQCILGTPTLTKYDKTSNLLVVTVVMDHQGGMKY